MQLDRIVIGTDFSCPSLESIDWVVHRVAPGAEFVIVHVVWIPEPPSFLRRTPAIETLRDDARIGAEHRLADLKVSLGDARVETVVRLGRVEQELQAVADARGADLIVVGRRGERDTEHGYLGSTAENIVRSGRTPVLVASGLHDAAPHRVLVALDESPHAASLLASARMVAARHRVEIVAMHVVHAATPSHVLVGPYGGDADERADEEQRAECVDDATHWLERLVHGPLTQECVRSETAFGSPAIEILAAAERLRADLIVIGSHGAGAIRRALLGSVASEVLRGARCAVLVVPPTPNAS